MRIPSEFLSFNAEGGKQNARVDLAGMVFDDSGKSGASFGQRVTLTATADPVINRARSAQYALALFHLGQLYMSKGNQALALQSFERYLNDEPNAGNADQVRKMIAMLR
jgi:hypothetical protein